MTQNALRDPSDADHRIALQIRAQRTRLGLTARQAGDRVGMDRSWWTHQERGRSARVATVARMAEAVGLRLDAVPVRSTLTGTEREAVANLLDAFVKGQRSRGRSVPLEITSALAKMRQGETCESAT